MITGFPIDLTFVLKATFIMGLTSTFFPLVYELLRGFHLRNHYVRHSPTWFRLIATFFITFIVFVPLQMGFSVFLILPIALLMNVLVQVVADDYITC